MAGHFLPRGWKVYVLLRMTGSWPGNAPSPASHAVLQGLRFTASLHGPVWVTAPVLAGVPFTTATPAS